MEVAVKTVGASSLQEKLSRRLKETLEASGKQAVVGYSAPHATRVHEDLEVYHEPPGQAKYLEAPSRMYQKEIALAGRAALEQGKTPPEALLAQGQLLLEKSQEIVPVDTGELRASGYVELRDKP
jgi:hypothetical protein